MVPIIITFLESGVCTLGLFPPVLERIFLATGIHKKATSHPPPLLFSISGIPTNMGKKSKTDGSSSEQQQQGKQQQSEQKQKSNTNTKKKQQAPVPAPAAVKKKKNPLWVAQTHFLNGLTPVERDGFFSNASVDPDRRAELWMEQADLGEKLINKYSWATPDERALRILKEFSPIVEIGCGANAFWCRSMAAAGIDIIGYDISVQEGGKIKSSNNDVSGKKKSKQTQNQNSSSRGAPTSKDDFQIRQGGPEVLASREVKTSNRTLFLCYPDEDFNQEEMEQNDKTNDEEMSVMGAACLEQYHGQYVVHVGELYGDTLSLDQAPWGRSSGRDFQQRLAAEYHCILKVGLQNWLHVKDTISVWKRSEKCSIVFAADDEDDEDEEVEYVHVPVEERLPVDVAAPCAQHLIMISHAAEGAGKGSLVKQDNAPLPLLPAGENSRAKKRQKSISEESSTIEHSDGYTCPW